MGVHFSQLGRPQQVDYYSNFLPNHQRRDLWFIRSKSGKSTQLTDGLSDAEYPVFDKGGQISFLCRKYRPLHCGNVARSSGFQRPVTRSVYAVVLEKAIPIL